ncbi:hypothetical protein [Streptomyces achromogenes]|uniref:hypothetical protein n=1 Tax=Streptomyces achromogenes TaxID=67255 RepID=UPI0036C2C4CE
MSSAQHLVDELERKRRQDPVPNALLAVAESDGLTPDHLRGLVRTESQCHHTEVPSYGKMLSRFPHRPAADFYVELIDLLHACGPKLDEVAESLGLPREEKDQWMWPADRRAYSYNGTLSWIAAQGSQASTALAVYTDMSVYFPGCEEIVEMIRRQRVDAPAEFISYYEGDPCEETRQRAIEVVQDGLDRGDDPREAMLMARLLEESIGDFWASAAAV